jgi:hypothetical protein
MKVGAIMLSAFSRSSQKTPALLLLVMLVGLFFSLFVGFLSLNWGAQPSLPRHSAELHDGSKIHPVRREDPDRVSRSGLEIPDDDHDDSLPDVGDVSPRRVH